MNSIWKAYTKHFSPEIALGKLRKGCEPRIMLHPKAKGSIVLVHGLSDSPRYMQDLADFFYSEHHYNVYLPLLQAHGLREPAGMEDVELEEWKKNVAYAVDCAFRKTPDNVSIGGLSTGGALSYYMAITSPKVTGNLFLFSAALDLVVKRSGLLGDAVRLILSSKRLSEFLDQRDNDRPLIGDNPYKYAYIDKDGARELVRLMKELDTLSTAFDRRNPFPMQVFAAHSYADDTANIEAIKRLQRRCKKGNFQSFYIKKDYKVSHGGLVLKDPIFGTSGITYTEKNVRFEQMTRAINRFLAV